MTIKDISKLFFEPSCGTGSMTIAGDPTQFYVNEIDPFRRAILNSIQFFGYPSFASVTGVDASVPFKQYEKEFDAVLTNPPFGMAEYSVNFETYKIKRLEHLMALYALQTMKDDGKAAIIIGGNMKYDDKGRLFGVDMVFLNYLSTHYGLEDVINISGQDMYRRMGTSFDTRLILINGRKSVPDTNWYPLEDKTLESTESFSSKKLTNFADLYNRVAQHIK